MERTLTCAQAREIPLCAYLESLGILPQKIRGKEWWYLSPLREERTPSFKVDKAKNWWYDHGLGKGGDLVSFGTLFHRCSIPEFLQKLGGNSGVDFSFHPPFSSPKEQDENEEGKTKILGVKPLLDLRLCHYLSGRKIPLALAKEYVQEVAFEVKGKPYVAIGFQNNSGGYELRNPFFKGCVAPKDCTLLPKEGSHQVAVFEGFFSFLSYLTLAQKQRGKFSIDTLGQPSNYLIVNSLSLLEKNRRLMEGYSQISLYLDRDTAGLKATEGALQWSKKYQDESRMYSGHKDLNEFLMQLEKSQKQRFNRGSSF